MSRKEVEISADDLVEIRVAIRSFGEFIRKHEAAINDQDDEIRSLQDRLIRVEGSLERTLSRGDRSELQIKNLDALYGDVSRLLDWKKAADSRMDKIATSFWGAFVTSSVAFIGAAVVFYIQSAKPAKISSSAQIPHHATQKTLGHPGNHA